MPVKAVLLVGPGRLTVTRGSLSLLGYELGPGDSVVVSAGRRLPALLGDDSGFEYTGRVEEHSVDFYKALREYSARAREGDRILVVGPSDSGKSTLSAFIVNTLASEGRDPLYATVDVGQNEAFCPGYTSSAQPDPLIVPGSRGKLWRACFVGSFTPREQAYRYIACSSRVAAGWRGPLVVDTDGWIVPWEGLESKAALAHAINADTIIAVNMDERAVGFLRDTVPEARIVRVPRLVESVKSREERRTHRERLIAKALLGASTVRVSVERDRVYGLPVFHGTQVDPLEASKLTGVRVLYAEVQQGGLLIVARSRPRSRLPRVRVLLEGWEKGLLASVTAGGSPAPAVLLGIDYRSRTITLASKAAGVDYVEVGKARVDPDAVLGRAKW